MEWCVFFGSYAFTPIICDSDFMFIFIPISSSRLSLNVCFPSTSFLIYILTDWMEYFCSLWFCFASDSLLFCPALFCSARCSCLFLLHFFPLFSRYNNVEWMTDWLENVRTNDWCWKKVHCSILYCVHGGACMAFGPSLIIFHHHRHQHPHHPRQIQALFFLFTDIHLSVGEPYQRKQKKTECFLYVWA